MAASEGRYDRRRLGLSADPNLAVAKANSAGITVRPRHSAGTQCPPAAAPHCGAPEPLRDDCTRGCARLHLSSHFK